MKGGCRDWVQRRESEVSMRRVYTWESKKAAVRGSAISCCLWVRCDHDKSLNTNPIVLVWWGGPHPYHGVLVWSDHIYRWHSPETDNQAFSPSLSSVVVVHGPAFWFTLSLHTSNLPPRSSFCLTAARPLLLKPYCLVRNLSSPSCQPC
jgi:hypothetical protein